MEELALAAAAGNDAAFEELLFTCEPMIQHLALRYRRTGVDTDDLVQEGFLGLLAAVRTFRLDGGASFRTYASLCIRRRMVEVLHREMPSVPLEDEEEEPGPDPAAIVVERDEEQRLWQRLRRDLTPLEYGVLNLYLGAYTYEEIARRLEVGTKAVDNALQRIRRKLANNFVR
ncbi:MAG: sigma-70 family RNA polymerase sigma factor [Oscillospiraceae bacterium]|nr:sigma-70 family RNA polymerase sigma factor [Oscillospiraceae bacterium]